MTSELHCPRCGKQLSIRLSGDFVFRCPRCKSQIGGETRDLKEAVITVLTVGQPVQKQNEYHT
jgi:tRNA(Ile2) C34 agmatinyltransferase TiaS